LALSERGYLIFYLVFVFLLVNIIGAMVKDFPKFGIAGVTVNISGKEVQEVMEKPEISFENVYNSTTNITAENIKKCSECVQAGVVWRYCRGLKQAGWCEYTSEKCGMWEWACFSFTDCAKRAEECPSWAG